MEILLQDLLPGQEYLIQLRSKNQQGVSQWSRVYAVTTDSDVVSPSPITGLSWTVSGTSFVGSWTPPTTDSDGESLRDFKDFKITLSADSSTAVFYVTEERFDLNLERNIGLFGSPKPTVAIKVEARDTIGNLSSPVTASASNPIPSDVAGLSLTPMLGGINVRWTKNEDDDFKKYELYSSTTSSSFTPNSSNIRYSGAGNAFVYTIGNSSTVYFKLRAMDVFDQPSANYASASSAAYPIDGVPDSTAPSQPSAPTISVSTLVAQVNHAMTRQAGGNLESDVDYLEVHASITTGFTPSTSTLRGTINSAGQGIAVSAAFFFDAEESMTNLYWKVIAVDKSKNKSAASNQTTGLPGLIESVNILDATITNGKIQNLSAAKLIAGTAIVNDLFIQAGLTVSSAGFIESDNYVSNISGWKISANGNAEFNNILARGDITSSSTSGAITNIANVESGTMSLYVINSGVTLSETFIQSGLFEYFVPADGYGAQIFMDTDYIHFRWYLSRTSFIFVTNDFLYRGRSGFNPGLDGREIWKNLTMNTNWSGTCQYKLFADGTIKLRGQATYSGALPVPGGAVIATLPTGYRPSSYIEFPTVGSGGSNSPVPKVTIGVNGDIATWDATFGNIYLDVASFNIAT